MRAVDREGDEAAGLQAPQPRRRQRGHPRPFHWRRIEKTDLDGLASLEAVDRADRAPDVFLGGDERAEDEANDRNADDGGGDRRERDTEPPHEAPAFGA
jgi:hypothetical protein